MSKYYFYFLIIFWIGTFGIPKNSFANSNHDLKISPVTSMFVNEDRTIMFEKKWNSPLPPTEKLYLYEYGIKISRKDQFLKTLGLKKINPKPTIRHKWELNDKGEFGDRIAGDKIYTRVVSFKEKKKTTLFFFATTEPQVMGDTPKNKYFKEAGHIEIINRPTFIEMLGIAWDKFLENR